VKKLRTIIFWIHLSAGVTAGLVIFVMSVTGALLAFEPQITRYAERDMRSVQPPSADAVRLSPATLIARAIEKKPETGITGFTLSSDRSASATVAFGREGVLFINPYTAEVLGDGAKGVRNFFRIVTDWHRYLALSGDNRAIGKAVTGAVNAAFLILAITGVFIWWPKQLTWRFLKPVTVFKLKPGTPRARDFNWHNVIGFWSSSILIILTITGLVISYQWANSLVYRVTGNQPPAPQAPPANPTGGSRGEGGSRNAIPGNLDQLWARAELQDAGWKSITLRLPVRADSPVSFSIENNASWNPIARSQLTLDQKTSEVTKWEPYAGLNSGRKLRSWARSSHTGEAGGILGQLLAGLASLGGAVLVVTGLSLAWRRLRGWLAGRTKSKTADSSDEFELLSGSAAD
jgi:uncharacterized iron-regulated membrane protein